MKTYYSREVIKTVGRRFVQCKYSAQNFYNKLVIKTKTSTTGCLSNGVI